MSWQKAQDPECNDGRGSIALVIEPRSRDLGDFSVRRVLPSSERKLVGPFIFFDEMGPADFPPGKGINVRPHPHIGISTVTYLLEGEVLHRDSLGYVQAIKPGAVNLMTAGRGIVHSERTSPELLVKARRLHGFQIWIALPLGLEEIEPSFEHYSAESLPRIDLDRGSATVVMGTAWGASSPVRTFSETIYIHIDLSAGAEVELPKDVEELAIYVVEGSVAIGDTTLAAGTMGVLQAGSSGSVRAIDESRVLVIGGAPIGDREIYWNFVSSRAERIEQAKLDWREWRFETVPGDDEFIPLPDPE